MLKSSRLPFRAPSASVTISILLSLICIGCTVNSRHRVLTFFFDGVPPLESESGMDGLAGQAGDTMTTGTQEAAFKPMIVSVHEPVRARNCSACHGMTNNGMMVIAENITLCDQCHGQKRAEEKWEHGPINEGKCIPCHVPHKSQYPALLSMTIPELCVTCHKEISIDKAYHAVPNFQKCLDCHDAHRRNRVKQ